MINALCGLLIRVNNVLSRWRSSSVTAGETLILLPRCIQYSDCKRNVVERADNCVRCGKCPVGAITRIAAERGIRVALATGGLIAGEYVRQLKPRLVVAIACELELIQGLAKVFPKPVLGIINSRSNGPCKNTTVSIHDVERVLNSIPMQREIRNDKEKQ